MVKAYSYDLRIRALAYLKKGHSGRETSEQFGESRKVLYDWKKREAETGDCKEKTGYQKGHSHKIAETNKLVDFLKDNIDKSSWELAELWPEKIARRTILRWIHKLGQCLSRIWLEFR